MKSSARSWLGYMLVGRRVEEGKRREERELQLDYHIGFQGPALEADALTLGF